MEWKKGSFTISDKSKKVDLDIVTALLSETYWGKGRPFRIVKKLVESSLCFSLYNGNRQIGFARVVSDFTVFSWLDDLVIDPEFRGRGLGRWLSECVLSHPSINRTQFVLQTTTAHAFYERLDFRSRRELMTRLPGPQNNPINQTGL